MRPALAVFAAAAVAQWLLPLSGIWRHERVIARGTNVRVECVAPDPYDPLRGRYLVVRPAESRVPKPEGMAEGMADRDAVPVWATLVAERFRDGKRTVAEIRLLDGQAVLTDLLLDGVSIRELVERRAD